jgi:uncharacterized protein involved in tolerance to divalent cations
MLRESASRSPFSSFTKLLLGWSVCTAIYRKAHVLFGLQDCVFRYIYRSCVGVPANFVNVILFQGIQVSALSSHSYDVHSICYSAIYMSRTQYMTWVSGICIITSDCMNMHFISCIESSSSLSNIFLWAIQAFQLKYMLMFYLYLSVLLQYVANCNFDKINTLFTKRLAKFACQ